MEQYFLHFHELTTFHSTHGLFSWDYQMRQEITHYTSNHRGKLIFCGFEHVIASGSLLTIGIDAVQRSLSEEKILEVEVIIRSLKEEAKYDDVESGVSDGE